MKKILVMILAIAMICMLMPSVAFAAITLSNGDYKNLSSVAPDTGITVSAGANVTLEGTAPSNVSIDTDGNTTIEIIDVEILFNNNSCFLYYLSGSDTLILNGTSYIKSQGSYPVIDVQTGTNLEISGDGTLFVSGASGQDIAGDGGNDGTLEITGDAAVFLQYGQRGSIEPTDTAHHYYKEFYDISDVPAEYTVPADWTFPCGAYLKYDGPSFTGAATNTAQKVHTGQTLIPLEVNAPSKMRYYNVISGSLPSGITVNNDGTFSGTASEKGTFNATIEVTDDGGFTATTDLELTVYKSITNVDLGANRTLLLGDDVTLTPTITPSDADIKDTTWLSSNPSVASVDSSGVVTANDVGSATITVGVTDEGDVTLYDTCTITVEKAVTGIAINFGTAVIYKDHPSGHDTVALSPTVVPYDATNKGMTLQSSDPSVATVDASGLVTAKKVGTATITVTADDTRLGTFQRTCVVTVEQAMTGFIVSQTTLTLSINDPSNNSATLTYEVVPENADILNVAWQSMDTNVATVDANGGVTATGEGTTQINVTVHDTGLNVRSATYDVTVKKTVTDVSFDNATASIDVGIVASVDAVIPYSVLPDDATDKSVTITSSNTDIATVIGGMVTGIKEGITRITVESVDNPSIKDEIILNVSDPTPPAKPSDKLGDVVGKLIDSLGNPLVGYNVTLCSDPQTVVTDANGVFRFTGVSYDEHALIVNSPVYGEIGRFTLSFASGSSSSATVDNGAKHIDIIYTVDTIEIDVLLQANAGITEFDAENIAFITPKQEYDKNPAQKIENPETGDFSP